MCVCVYGGGHLINKGNFTYGVGNRKHYSQLHLFFKEISSDGSFHVPED